MTDKKPPPPPVLSATYEATPKGWGKLGRDAALAARAGYRIEYVVPLGKQSFGALWLLEREDARQYGSFDPEDVGMGGVDDL